MNCHWLIQSVWLLIVVLNAQHANASLRQQVVQGQTDFKGLVYSVSSCSYQKLTTYTRYVTPKISSMRTTARFRDPAQTIFMAPPCYYFCTNETNSICFSFPSPEVIHTDHYYIFFGVQNGCTAIVLSPENTFPDDPSNCATDIWVTSPTKDSQVPGTMQKGCWSRNGNDQYWAFTYDNPSTWDSAPYTNECTELNPA